MTINEALEWADGQDDPEAKRHPNIIVKAEALRVLAAEVRALRQRYPAAVEAAFRAGYSAGGDDMSAAHHNEDSIGEDAAWLASDAKARLT